MKMAFVPLHQKVLYLCGLAVAGVLATGLLGAQAPTPLKARIHSEITSSQQTTLQGSLHPFARPENDAGRMPGGSHRARAARGRSHRPTVDPPSASERLKPERPIRLRYFCSPHRRDSALHPFIARLERAAKFSREDAAATKLEKFPTLNTTAFH